MFKKAYTKVKKSIQKLLNNDVSEQEPAPADAPTSSHKTVVRIRHLKSELNALTRGYKKSIDGLEKSYDKVLFQYEEHYQAVREANKKYRNGLIKESEVKQAESDLQPHQEALQDAGAELDKVKKFKREDTLNIISEIEALKEEYLSIMSEEIKQGAGALAQHKQEYLQKVSFIGKAYSDVAETDDMMQLHLQNNGLSYQKDKLKHTLELHTSDITIDMLTITPEEVADAMQGTTEYKL